MDPTYKCGSYLFASSLCDLKRGDAVAFNSDPAFYGEGTKPFIILGRMVAEENDVVQIKNGTFYLNDSIADDTMNLGYRFILKHGDFIPTEYEKKHKIEEINGQTILNFSYNELKKYDLLKKCVRILDTSYFIEPVIFGANDTTKWGTDNFGPVKIPKDMVFIMGDNRSNSFDSRHRGFTRRSDLIAKILN